MPAHSRATRGAAAFSGLIAGGVFFLVGWAAAALLDPPAAPHAALGAAVVDLTPAWLKDFAISTFGTADKVALAVCLALVSAALAAGIGVLAARRASLGVLAVGLLAAVCALAGATRADTSSWAVLPSVLGAVAGVGTLQLLLRRADTGGEGLDRRRFLAAVGGVTAGSALVAGAGGLLSRARSNTETVRAEIALPEPTDPVDPIPAGAQLEVAGMPEFVTPNGEFYRIDTAFVLPQVNPQEWQLQVHGLVDREVVLTFDELLDSALVEAHVTLTCVSNTVGGDLVGNATWIGLPVREVLARAGVQDEADMVLSRSADGFTASTPLEALTDDRNALLAVAMNGAPLPVEHGFPVRMVVPGLYGYVSATKWVTELKVTRFADDQGYWTTRGWDARGPIKTACRIDVPRSGAKPSAGSVTVAGTAWAQHRGIDRVQVQLDEGPWLDAELAATPGVDTWRQWSLTLADVPAGRHAVRCRAWDPTGVQTATTAAPAPNGSSGYHVISLDVR
ncbi:molybdopterin-dependent oxidoreductase [Ruania zhangjianzhongii]|uniref:molybdopterin-dependent oxidoreductase n=1 Tax=Ruania zhangjianzhongii TaxID=2603206 RepID=UPI0011C861A0|nr:molybdopterin-dependent oxidoreductase [Ruania zhangjianzhongii]